MIRRSFQKGHIDQRRTKNHGVVYDIYQSTRDLKAARMYLGHADEKTTELYTHANKANPEAARALEQVFFGDLLQTVTKNGLNRQPRRPM